MRMNNMQAIQFIGTQRSGSNLLRVMLNQLPEINAPHPPHIIQTMMPLLPLYGDLQLQVNFRKLVDDVCTLVELNPVNWNIRFSRDEVEQRCAENNLPQVMKAVYELKALQAGATMWCCKSMASIHYIDAIEASGIHPFYIHIYRDGRDVALSFMKAIVGEKHIYHLAKQWKEEQDLSLALCRSIDASRYIAIPYEQFVLDPESTIKSICEKLHIVYRPEVMDYSRSEESRETAASGEMWSNLVKPVMKDNTRKFLRELSGEDIALFETIAGDTLQQLGYELFSSPEQRIVPDAEAVNTFNTANKQLKNAARQKAAASDIEKRAAQDAFITSLKKQFDAIQH